MIDWNNINILLSSIVADSKSKSEVLRKLGLGTVGSNYATLNKYIIKYGLDVSHFDPYWSNISKIATPYPDDVVFIDNSTVQRSVVRKKIIQRELLPYKCAQCGITDIWNGKLLVLQLEHKNGRANDHRLVNLEFLCPNCHSQTDTYAGKNTKGDVKIVRKPAENTKRSRLESKREHKLVKTREFIDHRIKQIIESGVVIGEWGWLAKLSKILKITEQPLGRWIKKNAPDIANMAEEYKNKN